jgi:hypothetical protein
MKPSEYKAQYENLLINLGDAGTTTVKIHQYQRKPTDGGVIREKLINKIGSNGITDFELKVGPAGSLETVDAALTKTPAFLRMLRAPFSGKGAPQHCQLVLQLVHHFGLATNLQDYAESNLGLDCNGFVGNYLWHEWRTNGWTDPGLKDTDPDGPDRSVDSFRDSRRANRITRWSDINTNLLYLFIRADETTGEPITTNTGNAQGHIVISDVGEGPQVAAAPGGFFSVRVVESTASHSPPGLSENWYTCLQEKRAGNKTAVFKIDRKALAHCRQADAWSASASATSS